MSTVKKFKKALSMHCKDGTLKRGNRNLFSLVDNATLEPLCGLYVKEATRRLGSQGYFWGLNKNQLHSLIRMTCPRWVVLLFGSQEQGFVARGEEVNRLADSGVWSPQRSKHGRKIPTEYKIKENNLPREFWKSQNFSEIFETMGLLKA